jgi:hypothetical protein
MYMLLERDAVVKPPTAGIAPPGFIFRRLKVLGLVFLSLLGALKCFSAVFARDSVVHRLSSILSAAQSDDLL